MTKANLFFARGVMIVEGDAENILLPSLARLLGRDFTKYGVSIVNVGGIGLRRYARIFQRNDVAKDGELDVAVACVTDMDVMPDCAPAIIGKVVEGEEWPAARRWKAKRDLPEANLSKWRERLVSKASGQKVQTFVSDEWTLEYDLALGQKGDDGAFGGGFAEDVYVAACLADEDGAISDGEKQIVDVESEAKAAFEKIRAEAQPGGNYTAEEVIASHVYARFARDNVSKPVAAQYLARRLEAAQEELGEAILRERLPRYLIEAIDYVTDGADATDRAGSPDGSV